MDPLVLAIAAIVVFVVGLAAGVASAYLILHGRMKGVEERVRAESQGELARLSERVSHLSEDNGQLARECEERKRQMNELRSALETARTESSRLTERSSRVPVLEQSLAQTTTSASQLQQEVADLREKLGGAESSLTEKEQRIAELAAIAEGLSRKQEELIAEKEALSSQVAGLTQALEGERTQNSEKVALLLGAREQLANEFKVLANEILKEKARDFTDLNASTMANILTPFREKLAEFETTTIEAGKERTALSVQVKQLVELNQQLSTDAKNLTVALKGDAKTRGNWGELILERVLEASGLRKGQEYDVQESHTGDDGARLQPDVIIHLPENRDLVVDSKVALNAYEEYVNAESDDVREGALRRHIGALRTHIKGLSDKNYQKIYELKSLDFVLMFVPVEPAFMLGISHDNDIWQDAWKRNVLLVSPNTLLFVLRTVAHLWRQEQQTRNVQEIAHRGAELYDKLVGFVEDLRQVGSRIEQARGSYEAALNRLTSGKGNVIRQAELLRQLGVKPNKTMPTELVESALDESLALPSSRSAPAAEGSEPH